MGTDASAATQSLDSMDDHRRLTGDMIMALKNLQEHGRDLKLEEVVARIQEVLNRVENDFFRIAVVGEFKRGKSTLINALMGREILPADVLPCSATLNRVTYGLNPAVKLTFKPDESGCERQETIGIDELSEYVTKLTPDSEKRASDIKEATVYYPVKYCRDKADIIDTPGLNDDNAMTEVTMSVLPTVDAALLVILAQSPFSGYEADFLNRMLTNDLGRVIFVVNRLDEIRRPKDRERILDVVKARIHKAVETRAVELFGADTSEYHNFVKRIGEPKVFGISGGLALDAKLENDAELLAESKFPEFEEALERFLTYDRGAVSLQILSDCAAGNASKILHQINIQRGAMQMKQQEFEEKYQSTTNQLKDMRQRHAQESAKIEEAAARLSAALRPRAEELGRKMIETAENTIDSYPLTPTDVEESRLPATNERMAKEVSTALQSLARLESEKVELEIEKALAKEIDRLGTFAKDVARQLNQIEIQFRSIEERSEESTSLVKEGAFVLTGVVGTMVGGGILGTLVGGATSGYRVAGAKGAAVGGVAGAAAGFGTGFTCLMACGMMGLPLTWPVLLPTLAVAGVASVFGGKKITQLVFRKDTLEKYRHSFKDHFLGEFDAQASAQISAFSAGIDGQVTTIFDALKNQIQQELGHPIEQTQRTLDELHSTIVRSDAAREHELRELDEMAVESQRIQSKAVGLASQLREITSV